MCLWPLMQLCVVYVVKEVTSFRGLGQLMGVVLKECALELSDECWTPQSSHRDTFFSIYLVF